MQVAPTDIDAICELIDELCGVHLDASKAYLIESRLSDILEKCECSSYRDLVKLVREQCSVTLKQDIVDAITTNETLFFRDTSPYEALKHKAIPDVIDAKEATAQPKRIRIWSAACSTGQEPFSIAMTLCDLIPNIASWDISITATDISDAAIAKASRGRYGMHEIERGLPTSYRDRFFQKSNEEWVIDDRIRSMVSFRRFNLHDSLSSLGPFDIIFCRNVAIYFTAEQRQSLFQRLTDRLVNNGYLFVGASESLADLGTRFQPQSHCRAIFYRPNLSQLSCAGGTGI